MLHQDLGKLRRCPGSQSLLGDQKIRIYGDIFIREYKDRKAGRYEDILICEYKDMGTWGFEDKRI